ncbi:MAG: redox-sensing transcriptional repressor Rex [Holdemanella sp.]|nr:redox-sensing transcriptional repressor Rex [Holdemanella sp.]
MNKKISSKQLARYPLYLKYLRKLQSEGQDTISSNVIAKEMKRSEESVRKDFQVISSTSGKPKRGRDISQLISDIERFLGYKTHDNAIIVGAGQLGSAIANYRGFENYGIEIVALFDTNPSIIGNSIKGKEIYSIEDMKEVVELHNVKTAILCVSKASGQAACDIMIESGIKGILNFTPVHLTVPDDIVVESLDVASLLSVVSQKLNPSSD